jgi:transposase
VKGVIIDVDLYGQIRHLYVQEGLSQRAIAKRLGISRNTVRKYCKGENVPWQRKEYQRDTTVVTEEIREFIQSCIEQDETENLPKQRHTARRIYHRLKQEKGFTGAESTIRKAVREIRPKPKEAFLPLEFDPGEAAQVDWGEATVYIQEKRVKVQLFCYRLCYSADIFVKAFYRQNQESFLEGHINAFTHFGGIPRKIIFDNARVAVKEGFGIYAKPQAQYQALSAHYAFNMHFTNINSGNEKSLVENLVGWVRRNVLVPVPRVNNIDELNQVLLESCTNYRNHKIQGRSQAVREQSAIDCHCLKPLPAFVFDTSKSLSLRVGEDSLVQFDRNRYSVPVHLVDRQVTVKAFGNHLECYHDGVMVAKHSRCYGKGETTFCLEHYLPLLEKKPRAVFHAKPVRRSEAAALLAWGKTFPGRAKDTVKLLKLSITYGVDRLLAVKERLPAGITPTIELVLSELMPSSAAVIPIKGDIPVNVQDLSIYDRKYQVVTS